jgi:integrase
MKGMGPAAANSRLKVWRPLLKLAVREGLIASNPAAEVEKRKEAGEAHAPWEPEHVAQYRDRWPIGTPQRLSAELFYWTGARCIDARVLGRQMVDRKGWLCFNQEKTGGRVEIPMFAPLPGWCAAFEPDRQQLLACLEQHQDLTFIVTAFGAPRSQKGISQWMAANAREAGLVGLTAHGLRASRAIELYLIDATPQKIAAWTGHLSLQEVEHYTRAASRRKLLAGG